MHQTNTLKSSLLCCGRLTLYGVGFARVGHTISIEEAVFSMQNISYHLPYGVIVNLLLRGLWSKNLHKKEKKRENLNDAASRVKLVSKKSKNIIVLASETFLCYINAIFDDFLNSGCITLVKVNLCRL